MHSLISSISWSIIEAIEGQGPVADVIMDSLERMVDDDQPLGTRFESFEIAYALQLLQPYQVMVSRLERGQASDSSSVYCTCDGLCESNLRGRYGYGGPSTM